MTSNCGLSVHLPEHDKLTAFIRRRTPAAEAGGKWLVKPERGPRLVLFHGSQPVLTHSPG
jgi:hypothetical protein